MYNPFRDQGIDSLDVYEIAMALEGEFDIAIPDEIIAISETPNMLIENVFKIILEGDKNAF